MKKTIFTVVSFLLLLFSCSSNSSSEEQSSSSSSNFSSEPAIIWKGVKKTVTKNDGSDPALEANQDRITDKVWLSRKNDGGGLYNLKTENDYVQNTSPKGTKWAKGTTANVDMLEFKTFHNLAKPKSLVNQNLVLWLEEENIYIDIKITSWSTGKKGGFVYERSTQ